LEFQALWKEDSVLSNLDTSFQGITVSGDETAVELLLTLKKAGLDFLPGGKENGADIKNICKLAMKYDRGGQLIKRQEGWKSAGSCLFLASELRKGRNNRRFPVPTPCSVFANPSSCPCFWVNL
jgi:hypothetical protein